MGYADRIYGWLNSQLSIARFYGGIQLGGHRYVIDFEDPERPLVKWDVLKRDRREAAALAKKVRAEAKRSASNRQVDMLDGAPEAAK